MQKSHHDINNLVWMDLETTGLTIEDNDIIQTATLITDKDLNILDEKGYVTYIHIEQEQIQKMIPEVKDMHYKNGLIDKCLNSKTTLKQAETGIIDYISQYVDKNESPLCGNSVYFDKMFINKHMPKLRDYLQHRLIDVSTIMILSNMWLGKKYTKARAGHEAIKDIKNSLLELKYYKREIFDKI